MNYSIDPHANLKGKTSYPKELSPQRYILCSWPEIQCFMDDDYWKECYVVTPASSYDDTISSLMAPEDLYEKLTK